MRLSSLQVSLIAIFAALQVLLSIFPLSITIGVAGSITLGVAGSPLIGILLGPVLGGLAVLIGSLIGCFINPSGAIFGFLTVIPPFLGALGAGCIRVKRGHIIGAIILASLLIFYAHPYGQQAYIYPWLHIIAMIVAFSPIATMSGSAFTSQKFSKILFGAIISSFVGVMADHIAGCAIAIWYFSPMLVPEIWYIAMPVYPVERVIALIVASIIAASIYQRLKKIGLPFIR
ncbi:MAG: ECF transporter S component [Candidatus Bathyarchaeia archaeon]